MLRKVLFVLSIATFCVVITTAQTSSGPPKGTLIITGGDQETGIKEFVALAGGPDANIVYIPTAASSLRLPSGLIWEWLYTDTLPANTPQFQEELRKMFGVKNITILHTRNRKTANSREFVEPLRRAHGVWLSGGNPGRLSQVYLGTRTLSEIEAVLERGGVVGGNSAGAIIQGSYTIRGNPDKPVLMVKGREQGFAFLKNVAINPHLTEAMRQNELVTILDAHPKLLGIGIDEKAWIQVRGDRFQVFGKGRVAIYDNKKHDRNWYYWLLPGDQFDLRTRTAIRANRRKMNHEGRKKRDKG
ncbi:MAG TPA: cyanophycinase [Pyrinomonadaceae bacterium]|nr:cyanophycinase [Pyrinomonadaceae bacterium]